MNILKIIIQSVKIYKNNKLIWLLGLGMALFAIDVYSTVPFENDGLRCLIAPVQLTFAVLSSLLGTSLVILTFNSVQNKSAPYSEVWKEAKSKFFFRIIGAAFLYLIIILVFIIIYLFLIRQNGYTFLLSLFTILFLAVTTAQGSFIFAAIIIDDFEVGKAIRRGISFPVRFFFFIVPIAILFTLVNIGITFIFVSVYNSLGITNQIVIPEAHFYNSYLQLIRFTPVRIFNIFTQIFLAPLQSIAFTLAYLKLTPRIVKPEINSPLELEGWVDPV
jgi:hypothetical protein